MKPAFLLLCIALIISSCKKDKQPFDAEGKPITRSDSFYPMQIGNYWKISALDYTKIVDTLTIKGNLFYQFETLTGGDVLSRYFLRIDENNNLLKLEYNYRDITVTEAKFGAAVGDTFSTLGNASPNDFIAKVQSKTDRKIIFVYSNQAYNPRLGFTYTRTYLKGIGPDERYTTIKIADKVYQYSGN